MLSSLIGAKEKLPFAPFVNSNYLALSYQLVLSGTTEGGGKCVLYFLDSLAMQMEKLGGLPSDVLLQVQITFILSTCTSEN